MSACKHEEPEHLSADDMRGWLDEEVRNVLKECDLRVRDATAFTTGYVAGRLTSEEAHKRWRLYEERWPDPLGGIYASSYKTDDAIVAAIDEARRSDRKFRERLERKIARNRASGNDR